MVAEANINYLALLVAAIINIVLGFLWYSPLLFGKPWMKLMGFTEKHMQEAKKKGMTKTYIIMIISTLVMTYVLAHFVDYLEVTTVSTALQLGCWIWLGFVAPIMLGSVLWEGKSVKLYLINVLYYLVALCLMAIILALWV